MFDKKYLVVGLQDIGIGGKWPIVRPRIMLKDDIIQFLTTIKSFVQVEIAGGSERTKNPTISDIMNVIAKSSTCTKIIVNDNMHFEVFPMRYIEKMFSIGKHVKKTDPNFNSPIF